MYAYSMTPKAVIDGDTLDVLIDVGFETYLLKRIRLNKLNTPEKNTLAGKKAKEFVIAWFVENPGPYMIFTVKDRTEKYGRYLGDILTANGPNQEGGKSLVAAIIAAGLGLPWDGKGAKPIPKAPL